MKHYLSILSSALFFGSIGTASAIDPNGQNQAPFSYAQYLAFLAYQAQCAGADPTQNQTSPDPSNSGYSGGGYSGGGYSGGGYSGGGGSNGGYSNGGYSGGSGSNGGYSNGGTRGGYSTSGYGGSRMGSRSISSYRPRYAPPMNKVQARSSIRRRR